MKHSKLSRPQRQAIWAAYLCYGVYGRGDNIVKRGRQGGFKQILRVHTSTCKSLVRLRLLRERTRRVCGLGDWKTVPDGYGLTDAGLEIAKRFEELGSEYGYLS